MSNNFDKAVNIFTNLLFAIILLSVFVFTGKIAIIAFQNL